MTIFMLYIFGYAEIFTKQEMQEISFAFFKSGYEAGMEDAMYLQDDLGLVRLTEKDIEEKLN